MPALNVTSLQRFLQVAGVTEGACVKVAIPFNVNEILQQARLAGLKVTKIEELAVILDGAGFQFQARPKSGPVFFFKSLLAE